LIKPVFPYTAQGKIQTEERWIRIVGKEQYITPLVEPFPNFFFFTRFGFHLSKVAAWPGTAIEKYIVSFLLPFTTRLPIQCFIRKKELETIVSIQQETGCNLPGIL
jgi:hypothetical protein